MVLWNNYGGIWVGNINTSASLERFTAEEKPEMWAVIGNLALTTIGLGL